jgi:hypothetical protein
MFCRAWRGRLSDCPKPPGLPINPTVNEAKAPKGEWWE